MAKVSLKIKGTPKEVKKAIVHFADRPEKIFREADARTRLKK